MATTTLSKVGNSLAVILPKPLRDQAEFSSGEPLHLDCPRPGVIVITAVDADGDRLESFQKAETYFQSLRAQAPPWPADASADELLAAAKDERADEVSVV